MLLIKNLIQYFNVAKIEFVEVDDVINYRFTFLGSSLATPSNPCFTALSPPYRRRTTLRRQPPPRHRHPAQTPYLHGQVSKLSAPLQSYYHNPARNLINNSIPQISIPILYVRTVPSGGPIPTSKLRQRSMPSRAGLPLSAVHHAVRGRLPYHA